MCAMIKNAKANTIGNDHCELKEVGQTAYCLRVFEKFIYREKLQRKKTPVASPQTSQSVASRNECTLQGR